MDFRVAETISALAHRASKRVGLQFPEGLTKYAIDIAQQIQCGAHVETVILADMVYGACCVDDFTCDSLAVDTLVHYGHYCLVPPLHDTDSHCSKVLYVPVEVDLAASIDVFVELVKSTLSPGTTVALVSTAQFLPAIQAAKVKLTPHFTVTIPRIAPLLEGEILGCTAPSLGGSSDIFYFGDGKFHVEAVVLANPHSAVFQFNPYTNTLEKETYDAEATLERRVTAMHQASTAKTVGIVLSTLGRQGNPKLMKHIKDLLSGCKISHFVLLLNNISPEALSPFTNVDAWVQVACPRLSVDWGTSFTKPLLSVCEAEHVFNRHTLTPSCSTTTSTLPATASTSAETETTNSTISPGSFTRYPMDNWASSGSPWSIPAHRV
ncbi:diphthamide biosynthesis protein [Pelomyxa schiedti]|nr:diphthamide biosynthesis protein [Pelomyxa schiedti]